MSSKKVQRVERIVIPRSDSLGNLCHRVKNLYNAANYTVRQEFFSSGEWIRYNTLCSLFKDSPDGRALPAQTTQQTLKILDKNWKSFFNALKSRKKNPEKFAGLPRPPRYKDKDGEMIALFTNQQCRIRDGFVVFPALSGIDAIKTRLVDADLDMARIVPCGKYFVCEIVHTIEVPEIPEDFEPKKIIGIDLGVRNAATIVNNIGANPIVIRGGVLKSINQYYNKELARLKSGLDFQRKGQSDAGSTKIENLTWRRNQKINTEIHRITKWVADYAHAIGADAVVVGKTPLWKSGVNIGSKNNQNFVQIPHAKIIDQLAYKLENVGIKLVTTEESHTSKCSFLDEESIEHHDEYVGKRICRGLFESSNGTIINADANGAYNIIKKAFPKAFADGIEGVGLHPKRLTFSQPFKDPNKNPTRIATVGYVPAQAIV